MADYPKYPGQSGNEYALCIGLVAVVAIGTLTVLGQNVDTLFSGMVSTQKNPLTTAPGGPIGGPPPGGAPAAFVPQAGSPPLSLANLPPAPPGTSPVCFGQMCVNFPLVDPANDIVDTNGGNGAKRIHQFADVLTQLAGQIAEETGDDTLAQLVGTLANKGHALGTFQQGIVDAGNLAGASSPAILRQNQTDLSTAYNAVADYLAKHPGLVSPAVGEVMDTETQQIQRLSGAMSVNASRTSGIATFGTTTLIHQSANTICDQGGNNCYVPQ